MLKRDDSKHSSSASHSYSALSLNDPDDFTATMKRTEQRRRSGEIEARHDDEEDRRTSIDMDATISSNSIANGKSVIRRSSSSAEQSLENARQSEEDNAQGDNNRPIVKTTHWSRCWVWYVTLASILSAVVLMVILLVLKPWDRHKMAPIHNGAVMALPDEQPVWPIPKNFSFGAEKVKLSRDFRIRLQSSSNQPTSIASFPLLEKAIARCLDRLQLKRNSTIASFGNGDSVHYSQAAADLSEEETLSELIIIVDDAQAPLEYGMIESYALNITTSRSRQNTTFYQIRVDMDKGMPHISPSAEPLKQAVPGQHDNIKVTADASTSTALLKASTQWGIIHGLETFSQLVQAIDAGSGPGSSSPFSAGTTNNVENGLRIPNAPWSIIDEPRYSHRGLLLDTSRHYFPVKDIIRTLDAMSIVKLNVFHWHVLDQQSYPLVSQGYPDLTAKGAESPGFVYTPQDVSLIIQYGEERGIRVVPEFDAPGHTASWGRAYPNITVCLDAQPHSKYAAEPPAGQLDPLEPFTYTLLDGLVKEWAAQFPDKQVHIGGDEINAECWRLSDRLKDYIQNPGSRPAYEEPLLSVAENTAAGNEMLRTSSGSQSGIDRLLELYLEKVFGMYLAQGKRPIVWEEIALEHNVRLPSSAIVQVWKNSRNAKRVIEQGRPVILSGGDYWYLDCGVGSWLIGSQGESWCKFSSWQRMYSYSLTDRLNAEQQKMVYGGEVCMWSEQTDSSNLDSNLWPRTAAAAEVLWSGDQDDQGETRPLLEAAKRLEAVRERLIKMGVRAAPVSPSWCAKQPETCLA
ncbi:hypothetical protein BGX28_000037 [Mortierella sp. GBA30]|nr:hypothetical protein BGX28_000037 [Mortierella sp. GBA30]